MQITRKTWNNYIKLLRGINDKAANELEKWINTNFAGGMITTDYRDADGNSVIDMAYAISQQYGDAAAAVSAQMYDAIAEASGYTIPPAEMAANPSYGEIAKTVQGVLKTSQNVKELSSAVGRLVKRTGADTTLKNAKRDGSQFAWVPSGDTCAFCLTLASRGWQYMSKKALKNGHAEHIHSNCDCTYAIRFDSKTNVAGYDPDKYRAMYDNAEGDTPQERINSMRRMQYADHKDVINAQKREAYADRALKTSRKIDNINYAKASEIFNSRDMEYKNYTPQDIANNLETTETGRNAIRWIQESQVIPVLNNEPQDHKNRGSQFGRHVEVFMQNCRNERIAAESVIHEMVHYRYHIGGSQRAEAICMAHEMMHSLNRTYLTESEWNSIVDVVKKEYSDLPWENNDDGVYGQFKFVHK